MMANSAIGYSGSNGSGSKGLQMLLALIVLIGVVLVGVFVFAPSKPTETSFDFSAELDISEEEFNSSISFSPSVVLEDTPFGSKRPNGVNWTPNNHTLTRHGKVGECVAKILQGAGAFQVWMSDRDTVPKRAPRMPAIALAVNVGKAYRLGVKCEDLTPELIKREFNAAYDINDLLAVAIFGRQVSMKTLGEEWIQVSFHLVPKRVWPIHRCEWFLTIPVFVPDPRDIVPCK